MNYCKHNQQGIALLIIVIIIMLASITYVVSDLSYDEIRINHQSQNAGVLKKAKDALLAHALTNSYTSPGRVGNLPCPDVSIILNDEGEQDSVCGVTDANTIGYFPWKRMGVDVLRDTSGNCLLYAVSPSYKPNPDRMLNEDSNGMFQVVDIMDNVIEGVLPEDRIVAVIIAPNGVLGSQARNFDSTTLCGKDIGNLDAYLDDTGVRDNSALSGTANTIDKFVHATSITLSDKSLNDTFVTIKKSEIWDSLFAKTKIATKLTELTEALTVCLANYANANANRQLPWPAPLDLSASTDSYFENNNYDDLDGAAQGYAGRYSYIVDSSNANTGVTGMADNSVFTAGACTAIDLPSTSAVTESINLSVAEEYGIIWSNWKDHFFYALSKKYQPDSTASSDSICGGAGGCVSVNGTGNKYAAVVFFSGKSINNVTRTSPEVAGDSNEKANLTNYLENGNATIFPDAGGDGAYESGLAGNNDVIFCVRDMPAGDALTVVPC